MPTSFTEIIQQSGQLLDHIKNHPIDWKLAITWIVIVAIGCWLWAEFIELLESRRSGAWLAQETEGHCYRVIATRIATLAPGPEHDWSSPLRMHSATVFSGATTSGVKL
jgi:hypothetical protein